MVTIGPKPFGVLKLASCSRKIVTLLVNCHYRAKTLRGTETTSPRILQIRGLPLVTIGPKPFGVLKLISSRTASTRRSRCHYRAKTLRGTETSEEHHPVSGVVGDVVTIGPKPFGVLKRDFTFHQNLATFGQVLVTIGPKPFGVLKLYTVSYSTPLIVSVTIGPKPFGVLKPVAGELNRHPQQEASLSGQNPSGYRNYMVLRNWA